MKLYKYIPLCLLLCSVTTYAHQDFSMVKTFGNVRVRITTGYDYEEINKVWIIGELSFRLAKDLKYKDTIFLDFEHHYTEYCNPDYFISFDNGSIKGSYDGAQTRNAFLKKKGLVIRQVSRKFLVPSSLQLLEYAIINISSVKGLQRQIGYNKNYCEWLINSIDTNFTRKIVLNKPSETVTKVLANKVYRLGSKKKDCDVISYYFQNNKFHVFYNECDFPLKYEKDSILVIVDNIYQFEITDYETVVLDTDSTFYITMARWPPPIKRFLIENKPSSFYEPFEIKKIGSDKITITFQYYIKDEEIRRKDRTVLYRSDKEDVTQDLDKKIDD